MTILGLINLIIKIAGSQAHVEFERNKPRGQPRRIGDYSKARELLGFKPRVGLAEGIGQTISWYRDQQSR